MVEEIRDAVWYAKNRGLSNKGGDITLLIDADISVAEIDKIFDGKVNKNGWRYDKKPDQKIVGSILELYKRVTGKSKVTNNQLNLTFARGVVAWLRGTTLDWAKYAVFCNKYADDLRHTKAANRELKEQGGLQVQQPSLRKHVAQPPVTGRPRGAAIQSAVGNCQMKEGRESNTKPMVAGFGGPQWQAEETFEVKQLLQTLKIVLTGAKHDIVQAQEQHAIHVAAFQVTNMHLEGRKKVFVDSEYERLTLEKELSLLKMNRLQEDTLPSRETCTLGLREAQQRLDWASKSASVAMSMLNSCTKECKKSREKADFSLQMLAAKRDRVQELGAQIQCVEQQLEMMSVGAGFSFYPQPVISNPDFVDPFTVIHVTNCPVCGNGFEFKDILVTSCGHTYHLICLQWHSKTSLSCKLASCLKPFAADWLLSVGIRPLSKLASVPAGTTDQSRRTTWMQKFLQRGSQVLPLTGSHEEQPSTLLKECCKFDVSNIENLNEPGWSVHASNLGSGSYVISPESNSVSLSYNGPFQPSVNVNNDTRTCLICFTNTPDIKFKDCGHSGVCKPCLMQQPTKRCPFCCLDVTGFVRQIDGDVSSPLRPVEESALTLQQKSVHGKPSSPIKLDLSAAFNAEIVPQFVTKDNTSELLSNPQLMHLETTSEEKEVVSNGPDFDDSDLEDLTNPALVHFLALPVVGKPGKQPLSGEALTSGESESEGDDGPLGDFAGEGAGLVTMGTSDLTNKGDARLRMGTQEVQPNVKDSKATKKQQVLASPSQSCGKRVTRAEVALAEKTIPVKNKKRRRKKATPAVKAFNSFS